MLLAKGLSEFLKGHPFPIVLFDPKSRSVLDVNAMGLGFLGYSSAAIKRLSLTDLVALNGRLRTKKPMQTTAITRDGMRIPVGVHYRPARRRNRDVGILIFSPAETPAKDTPLMNRVFKDALEGISQGILVFTDTLRISFVNAAAARDVGYRAEAFRRLSLTELFKFPDELGLAALLNSLRRNETEFISLQLKITRKDGSSFDADVQIRMIDQGSHFLMMAEDITERLGAERKLLDTVREKEALIKEIHHRVKNNLQLISSILYLKLIHVEQDDIRSFLEGTREKIRSIALIHERLLQSENINKVEISDYLGKLVQDLQTTWLTTEFSLKVHTFFDHSLIQLDNAIMCGLIVNEVMTNALKHAFRGRKEGNITVIFREHKGSYLLSVADDGISLPDHIAPGAGVSFGMQLIDVFVRQLSGRLEILREKGTNFQIHF